MISAVDFCKQEINMRTVLSVAVMAVSGVGYLVGPAAAKPRDCFAELNTCESALSQAGYSKKVTANVCTSRMGMCWQDNEAKYGTENGRPPEENRAANKPKPKKEKEWKRPLPHIANPAKSGVIGSNAQLGIKATTPATAATTAIGSASPTTEIKTSPPKPATVSNEAIAKRAGAGRL
jgi:hypothetical protein